MACYAYHHLKPLGGGGGVRWNNSEVGTVESQYDIVPRDWEICSL